MVIPLTKTTKNSDLYQRRPDVEELLSELDKLDPDQLVSRLTCTQQAVPYEILIYYLRHSEIGLPEKHLNPIFTAFYSRLETTLRIAVPSAYFDDATAIRDEVAERVVEMIAKDRCSQNDIMYYWETNFNHALINLRRDVLRKIGPARETDPLINSESLAHESGDDLEVSSEVEIAAADFINPNPSKLDDTTFRFLLMEAIDGLPKDEKHAIGLFLQGMQIESKDPKVLTISKALGCTDRTIRNRLKRAHMKLRIALQEEEVQ